ncbi:alpha/beta fold hydrolase [Candidatus Neomarinimicrobiota bacterium]
MQLKKLYLLLSFIPLLILYQCTYQSDKTTLSSDGIEISFNVQGKGKPAIFFVHGWTNNKTIWDDQVKYFSEKYKVVTIDLAGHGKSEDKRENWTMSAFGDDVVAVINKLRLKEVVLVGFSMGGPVIVESAKKIPEIVEGLIFVDTMQDIDLKYSSEMIDNHINYMMDFVTNPSEEKSAGFLFKRNNEESFKRASRMLENASQVGWEKSLRGLYHWYNEESVASIKEINPPIIAINSDLRPTNIKAIRKYIPSFDAKIINNTGHVVFWDGPDEFNQILGEAIKEFSE